MASILTLFRSGIAAVHPRPFSLGFHNDADGEMNESGGVDDTRSKRPLMGVTAPVRRRSKNYRACHSGVARWLGILMSPHAHCGLLAPSLGLARLGPACRCSKSFRTKFVAAVRFTPPAVATFLRWLIKRNFGNGPVSLFCARRDNTIILGALAEFC